MLRRSSACCTAVPRRGVGSRADWVPKQPIKILVGYRAGRHRRHRRAHRRRHHLSASMAYAVVVDNKTGAGGFIALEGGRNAPPDGYTVGIGIMGQLAVGPVVPGSQIPLDLDKELVPICNLVGVPMALIVRMDAPFKTIPELVAYAKANPGKVTYASTGAGLDQPARRGIPRGGSGRAQADPRAVSRRRAGDRRRGGRAMSTSSSPMSSEIMGMVRGGKVRALALAASQADRRSRPSCRCSPRTFRRSTSTTGSAWSARRRCRPTSRRRSPSCSSMRWPIPRTRKRSTSRASSRMGQGPDAFAAYIQKDRERWAKVVKAGNIKAE